ncbi:AAA family ATPase [Patulibacter medicamentivorans]|uniref:AAA family ATPase n=1 Tax=Patulibacter medicamentivorans TaxID=1097667 RepID=UPI0009D9BA48|nr:AAA family ATPase [Patulibacter medicamentivorans]
MSTDSAGRSPRPDGETRPDEDARPLPRRARDGAPIAALTPVPAPSGPPATLDDVAALADRLRQSVRRGMRIGDETLDVVLATLLAGGHLLIEDHPGVGKTRLAQSLARAIGGSFARVQATVDLLPGDVIGASVWRADSGTFEFRPGPVFTNVLLVDEINRATPKTQSGLLEAMQERQATVDGVVHPIAAPFLVVATQNPTAGFDGTYPLPPAQLDRFLARVSLGYPEADAELSLLRGEASGDVVAVAAGGDVERAQAAVAAVHASDLLLRYLLSLLRATRDHPLATVGASPRAGLLLLAAARARAAISGRDFVLPDDVQTLAPAVLTHRVQTATGDPDVVAQVVADALAATPAR